MALNSLILWGMPVAVTSWRSPQSPTVRLRERVGKVTKTDEIYSLATAPNNNTVATGVVGLTRTLTLTHPGLLVPDLEPLEEEMLEKLKATFQAEKIGWVTLDLKKDKVGFARHYVRTELAHLL